KIAIILIIANPPKAPHSYVHLSTSEVRSLGICPLPTAMAPIKAKTTQTVAILLEVFFHKAFL
ncbi:MAG: hypothetical protein RSD91_07655, partial [Clostridiales bacterium]